MGFMGDVCEGMWQGLHSSTSCSSFHLILGILNFVAGGMLWGSGDDQRGSFYVCHLQETDTVNTPTTYTTSQTQDPWAGYSLPAALFTHAQKTNMFNYTLIMLQIHCGLCFRRSSYINYLTFYLTILNNIDTST